MGARTYLCRVAAPAVRALPCRRLWRRRAVEPFLKLWEYKVCALLLLEGKFAQDIVAQYALAETLRVQCRSHCSTRSRRSGRDPAPEPISRLVSLLTGSDAPGNQGRAGIPQNDASCGEPTPRIGRRRTPGRGGLQLSGIRSPRFIARSHWAHTWSGRTPHPLLRVVLKPACAEARQAVKTRGQHRGGHPGPFADPREVCKGWAAAPANSRKPAKHFQGTILPGFPLARAF